MSTEAWYRSAYMHTHTHAVTLHPAEVTVGPLPYQNTSMMTNISKSTMKVI